jgi:polygalacturonase
MKRSRSSEAGALSVSDTGARGDGAGDDSEAIQRALDAPARIITIPAGVYRLDS